VARGALLKLFACARQPFEDAGQALALAEMLAAPPFGADRYARAEPVREPAAWRHHPANRVAA
jgi:hypothetical protein